MKNYVSKLLLVINILVLNTTFTPIKADLTAATYNITHGKKNNWPKRQPGVCNVIKQMGADMYGFQEVITKNDQFTTIEKTLPGYSYVGQPRSTGVTGISVWHRLVNLAASLNWDKMPFGDEYNPIFYKQEKLELLDNGTFGINATGWRSTMVPRICTWALFKEKVTNKEFFTYNTHLDNSDENTRTTQIKLVTDDIKQRCDNKPVILMGDLNTTFVGDMQETLSDAGFTHARTMTKEGSEVITTHLKKGKPFEIDHILVKPSSAFTIKNYKVCGERSDTTSDHNPVCMTFSLN